MATIFPFHGYQFFTAKNFFVRPHLRNEAVNTATWQHWLKYGRGGMKGGRAEPVCHLGALESKRTSVYKIKGCLKQPLSSLNSNEKSSYFHNTCHIQGLGMIFPLSSNLRPKIQTKEHRFSIE